MRNEPDLVGKRGTRWRWDAARNAYRSDGVIAGMTWSRSALETLHGPMEEVEDPAMALATDFITGARLLHAGQPEAALDVYIPTSITEGHAHRRVHLLTMCGAVITGAAVRNRDPNAPTPGDLTDFYSFELTDESDEPQELPPAKVLAARLMTVGANLDKDLIKDLIVAACSVSGECRLLTQTLIELAKIYAALDAAPVVTG